MIKKCDRLFQTAYRQQGYFTAKEAKEAGYPDSAHVYHVKAGNWVRETRGIYRLSVFSEAYRPDLVIYWLWSSDRQGKLHGVYSHRTALDLHDLCDIMPRKVHMTVPPGFRRTVYPKALVLHQGYLRDDEITSHDSVPVTTVYRTLIDMVHEQSASPEQLVMALDTALERGIFTQKTLAKLRSEFHPDYRLIDFLLESITQ